MKLCIKWICAFSALASINVYAATAQVTTQVDRIVIDDVLYAGCLVYIPTALSNNLAGCADYYATLDCTGELGTSKTISSAKLNAAYLGLATGKRVIMVIDDSRKANGYCLAKYFEVTEYEPL